MGFKECTIEFVLVFFCSVLCFGFLIIVIDVNSWKEGCDYFPSSYISLVPCLTGRDTHVEAGKLLPIPGNFSSQC